MNIDLTEKWAKEIALMSDADFEENCKYVEILLNRRKQALRIHDVSGSLDFDKGYEQGYNDATREACQEIAKNYQPNDR
jgi:hypothetical protein